MSSATKAAKHLTVRNLEVFKNTNFQEILSLFGITQKLILEHSPQGRYLRCLMIKWSKGKVRVYSDSVLCLRKLSDPSEANRRWDGQVADFQLSASYEESLGIDGEPIELEWNIFSGLTSLQIPQRIQNDLQERNIQLEKFGDRIIFMLMLTDIE